MEGRGQRARTTIPQRPSPWIGLVCALSLAGMLPAAAAGTRAVDETPYRELLVSFVDERGDVDYRRLKAERAGLDAYVAALGELSPEVFGAWPEKQRIALLVNAYNAFTLKAIVDEYPIKPRFFTSFLYPKNSIRQISGVWDELSFKLVGESVTLEHLEHGMLRKDYSEPRIHFAINCASASCPPLRREPYVAERLDAQLADQSRRFFAAPMNFRINAKKRCVYVSSILDWFGSDFLGVVPAEAELADFSDEERAVLSFIAGVVGGEDAKYLRAGDYRLNYLDYDWSLNEQGR